MPGDTGTGGAGRHKGVFKSCVPAVLALKCLLNGLLTKQRRRPAGQDANSFVIIHKQPENITSVPVSSGRVKAGSSGCQNS